jgi:hypothetical protein
MPLDYPTTCDGVVYLALNRQEIAWSRICREQVGVTGQ